MSGNEPAQKSGQSDVPPGHEAEAQKSGHDGAPIERDVEAQQRWWHEQWLRFPSVCEDADGGLDFWAVAPDTGVYQDDWPHGERLARDTLAHMRRFPEGASVLRRILARIDHDSTVAQGFINHIEEVLARPELYPPIPDDLPPRPNDLPPRL